MSVAPSVAAIDALASQAQLRRLARSGAAPWLHAEVARRMAERLAVIRRQPHTVIDWGASLGAGSQQLAAVYPEARRILVEDPGVLLECAVSSTPASWWSPRRWMRAPPEVIAADRVPNAAAELLWSNMALHFAADAPALLRRWQDALAGAGFLMFSTFGPDTLRELRSLYAESGWGSPAQDFADLHDIGDALVAAGFADPVMDQEHLTLTWAGPTQLLAELRSLGGNLSPRRFSGLRTPRWRAEVESRLAARCGNDGRIALTFEVIYGHAFKAESRAPVAAETRIALNDVRAMVRRPRGR